MPLTSRKPSLDMRAILIQGDSVRMIWGTDDSPKEKRRPLRREGLPRSASVRQAPTDDLSIRLAEELDYARRLLDSLGDELSNDPILIRRHAVALQSLDRVGQILGHIRNVVRSSDPRSAVAEIGMSDLKARLSRNSAL